MSIESNRDRLRDRYIGSQDKQLFLVEGSDDATAYSILFQRFAAEDWEQRWALAPAGNKRQLGELLALEPGWLGLVDRDEWDPATVDQNTSDHPNLLVLPRFCLENYLIDPAELWQAIPAARQAKLDDGERTLSAELIGDLPQYRRHAALWAVVTPLWSGLRARGFKEALAFADSLANAQDDATIQRILGDWDALLDPQRIFADFQACLSRIEAAPQQQQLHHWIHGKVYWTQVVNPAMNRLFGQMSATERRTKILNRLPRPADLNPILTELTAA